MSDTYSRLCAEHRILVDRQFTVGLSESERDLLQQIRALLDDLEQRESRTR